MTRIDHKVLIVFLGLIATFGAVTVHAQQANSGSVCVLAYEDTNKNQARDAGEALLSNVGVSLMVNNVIIANHVTDGTEPFCFKNLTAQQYTVNFSSPLAQATTLTSFTFPLGAGEQVTKEYGAVTALATEAAPVSSIAGITITPPLRIGASAAGAIIAMVFAAAFGMILYGLFWRRLRR